MFERILDRVLAMVYHLTAAALADPPAFAALVLWMLTCLVATPVLWHYLNRGRAALVNGLVSKVRSRRAPAGQIPEHVPADPQSWTHLDACEQAWRATPSLRARLVRRARERKAIHRARTRT